MSTSRIRIFGVLGTAILILAGCAETQFLIHTAKRVSRTDDTPQAGTYKVGKPYQIKGIWYHPAEDYAYDESGIASWYGAAFHGKLTANGETYDMNALTAAHRTLPMPSFVRVTNLENGRSLVLKVNDRGPFAKGRIIDISRRGSQLLGFQKHGPGPGADPRRSVACRGGQAAEPRRTGAGRLADHRRQVAEGKRERPDTAGAGGRRSIA